MKFSQILWPLFLLLFMACHGPEAPPAVQPSAQDSMNAQIHNLPGVYYGILPCADCNGIEYTLTLNPDSSFFLKSVYYGKPADNNTFVESGNWSFAVPSTLTLETSQETFLLACRGKNLLWLNNNGQEIKGSKANYQLSRIGNFDKE